MCERGSSEEAETRESVSKAAEISVREVDSKEQTV